VSHMLSFAAAVFLQLQSFGPSGLFLDPIIPIAAAGAF
jgi:hypothetical protein